MYGTEKRIQILNQVTVYIDICKCQELYEFVRKMAYKQTNKGIYLLFYICLKHSEYLLVMYITLL